MKPLPFRTIAYWTFTLPVAFENAAGAVWSALRLEYLRVMLAELGYPQYFMYILGPWQFACAAVLLWPRLPRAKEWAYAGAFFNYSSAFVSHLFAGHRPDIPSGVMAVFTLMSWALRPPDRRLADPPLRAKTTAAPWLPAACTLGAMLMLSLLRLPSGSEARHDTRR